MAEPLRPDPNQLVPVDILKFRNTTRDINFDVFLKLPGDNYVHVFSRTTGLDYKRLAQYITKGVTELFIHREDKKTYDEFVARTAESIFNDPKTPQEKKIATLLNMTEQNMAELFSRVNVPEQTAENARKVVNNYVHLMTENPNSLAIVLKLVSHGDYLYYHSIAVSIFSMFIAKASGQFNRRMLEIVGLGGFVHDIGSTQINKDILESSEELTAAEWKIIKEHPKLGLKMIESTPNVPDEVRYIVYQHHEQPGGGGYPQGLRSPVIYYPAKIVAVADAFSALLSARPHRPAFSIEKAIAIMESEKGKYDRELVALLKSVFLKGAVGDGGVKSAA